MNEECTCKFKETCWVQTNDGCKIKPSRYINCYEYMKFEFMNEVKEHDL